MSTSRKDDASLAWTLTDASLIGHVGLHRQDVTLKDFFEAAWEIPRRERRDAIERTLRRAIGSHLVTVQGRRFAAQPPLIAVLEPAQAVEIVDFIDEYEYHDALTAEVLRQLETVPAIDSDWRMSDTALRRARRDIALERAWVEPVKILVLLVILIVALPWAAISAVVEWGRGLGIRSRGS